MSDNYDNTSISMLKGADRVRLRPSVIFGSTGLDGCCHAFFEILSNSIDEARQGRGDVIKITRFLDSSIEIQDYGVGAPVDYNEKEERYNWELIFCELYAGGKYDNNSGGSYEFSLGLNGLGLCATQYASEYMEAEIVRGDNLYQLQFRRGENVGGLTKLPRPTGTPTGTRIKWRPDLEVFTDIDIPLEYYDNVLRKQAVVNKGLRFILLDQKPDGSFEQKEYLYQNGIVDYIKEIAGEKAISDVYYIEGDRVGSDREDKPDYRVKLSAAFCFNPEVSFLEYYHNSSHLEHGGSPDKAARNAFVYCFDQYLKNNNKYNKNESKIIFSDVADCLCYVSNTFSTETSYENQTKKAITNKFIQDCLTEFLRENIEIYLIENKQAAERIAEQILVNKRSRESAEKARVNVKKMLSGNNDLASKVQKFVDCRTKDKEKRELYIVEGDSALGSCKLGRDSEFQAIIPVRGKILNCLKADYNKIFKNEIILDIVRVLGCGVEAKSKHNKDFNTFNIENLRYNKIIICTDADYDGYQIRVLILTMFYCLMPSLIEEGYMYIAESPLYEITSKGNKPKTYFAYNEKEKQTITNKLGEGKYILQRSKGLGENQPDMMWQTTMNPESRRLIKVISDEDSELIRLKFELLQGDNLSGRKEHIAKYGSKYLAMTDIF